MEEVKKEENAPASQPPLSLLEEVRTERMTLEKVRDEARAERIMLEKLKANELLSSSAGIRVEAQPKVESNKEYRRRIEKELREQAKKNVGV